MRNRRHFLFADEQGLLPASVAAVDQFQLGENVVSTAAATRFSKKRRSKADDVPVLSRLDGGRHRHQRLSRRRKFARARRAVAMLLF
jgi:hypothetical protein